jgi:phosphate transport system protein
VNILSVTRYLERIEELSTNITEDVVFMVEDELIHHKGVDTYPNKIGFER